jgi:hypothetical protein
MRPALVVVAQADIVVVLKLPTVTIQHLQIIYLGKYLQPMAEVAELTQVILAVQHKMADLVVAEQMVYRRLDLQRKHTKTVYYATEVQEQQGHFQVQAEQLALDLQLLDTVVMDTQQILLVVLHITVAAAVLIMVLQVFQELHPVAAAQVLKPTAQQILVAVEQIVLRQHRAELVVAELLLF